MSLARYADPVTACIAELSLGCREPVLRCVPDAEVCDHIARLLRRGVVSGVGIGWTLKMPIGVRYDQPTLDAIANDVEQGYSSGDQPAWLLEVRA